MKFKNLFILILLIFMCPLFLCNDVAFGSAVNSTTAEETLAQEFNNNVFKLTISFISGVYNSVVGRQKDVNISSQSVNDFSNAVKSYQTLEEKSNSDYKNSKEKEKLDFWSWLLDMLSGILYFFKK